MSMLPTCLYTGLGVLPAARSRQNSGQVFSVSPSNTTSKVPSTNRSGQSVGYGPPTTTVLPRRRNSWASSFDRRYCGLQQPMATMSASVSNLISSTFSSWSSTGNSRGVMPATVASPSGAWPHFTPTISWIPWNPQSDRGNRGLTNRIFGVFPAKEIMPSLRRRVASSVLKRRLTTDHTVAPGLAPCQRRPRPRGRSGAPFSRMADIPPVGGTTHLLLCRLHFPLDRPTAPPLASRQRRAARGGRGRQWKEVTIGGEEEGDEEEEVSAVSVHLGGPAVAWRGLRALTVRLDRQRLPARSRPHIDEPAGASGRVAPWPRRNASSTSARPTGSSSWSASSGPGTSSPRKIALEVLGPITLTRPPDRPRHGRPALVRPLHLSDLAERRKGRLPHLPDAGPHGPRHRTRRSGTSASTGRWLSTPRSSGRWGRCSSPCSRPPGSASASPG